uniref:Uncharacterized protein n=1 Tax=Myripristis murdjan TaxID=586833 RepID=A0A667Z8L5_9TELE
KLSTPMLGFVGPQDDPVKFEYVLTTFCVCSCSCDTGKLVTDFECLFYSKRAMNCSWTPKNPSLDLENENKNKTLSACEHLYSEGTRRGCRLIIEHLTNDVCILLRGTLNGLSVENTFKRRPTYHVKAPPPKLTVTEEGDKLKLSWTAPDVGLKENSWSYSINYSKCGSLQVLDGYSLDVPYDKRCRYTFQIMGNIKRDYGKGESLISEAVTHGNHPTSFISIDFSQSICCFPALENNKYTTHKKLGIFGFRVKFMENVKSSHYSDIIS